jgi:DNA topoisomerase IA
LKKLEGEVDLLRVHNRLFEARVIALEGEMDRIAEGEMSKDEVVEDSRKMLHVTIDEILNGEEELSKLIWAGMDQDRILGPCLA